MAELLKLGDPFRVALLAYPGVTQLDLTGPQEVFKKVRGVEVRLARLVALGNQVLPVAKLLGGVLLQPRRLGRPDALDLGDLLARVAPLRKNSRFRVAHHLVGVRAFQDRAESGGLVLRKWSLKIEHFDSLSVIRPRFEDHEQRPPARVWTRRPFENRGYKVRLSDPTAP